MISPVIKAIKETCLKLYSLIQTLDGDSLQNFKIYIKIKFKNNHLTWEVYYLFTCCQIKKS